MNKLLRTPLGLFAAFIGLFFFFAAVGFVFFVMLAVDPELVTIGNCIVAGIIISAIFFLGYVGLEKVFLMKHKDEESK